MDALACTTTLILTLALVLDALFGEVRRYHPLAGFGRVADMLERALNRDHGGHGGAMPFPISPVSPATAGLAALVLLVLPPVALAAALPTVTLSLFFGAGGVALSGAGSVALSASGIAILAGHVFVLYLCIGARSLRQHARAVQQRLAAGDVSGARQAVAQVVSRDATRLAPTRIAVACIESVVENGNDAVFGVFLWYALLGLPGAVCYRLVNTLDAMWGYRSPRFKRFGRAAARFDDLLNWLPARLSALAYCVAGRFKSGWRCWRQQGPSWKSTNAGAVMAAGSGALQVTTGGAEVYAGTPQQRPLLGCGRDPQAADIGRAITLVSRATLLWLGLILLLEQILPLPGY